MREYYVIINDQQQGPFTIEQLAEMGITPETEVWAQGMADWQQAGDVAELTPLLQQLQFQQHMYSTPPPHRPRQQAATAGQPTASAWEEPAQPNQPRSRKGVKWLVALLCLLIVVAVLAVTCPKREQHKQVITTESRAWLSEKVKLLTSPLGEFAPLVGSVVDWLGGQGVDYVIDQYLEVNNYVVCSVGRINTGEKARTISVGVMGHVFTFDKEDVDDFLLRTIKRELGLESNGPVAQQNHAVPLPADPIEPEEEDDSYLAPPFEDGDSIDDDDLPSMAQELIDSVTATAKREAVKGAKKWIKKQLEKVN